MYLYRQTSDSDTSKEQFPLYSELIIAPNYNNIIIHSDIQTISDLSRKT